jgi:hypothetical protein
MTASGVAVMFAPGPWFRSPPEPDIAVNADFETKAARDLINC